MAKKIIEPYPAEEIWWAIKIRGSSGREEPRYLGTWLCDIGTIPLMFPTRREAVTYMKARRVVGMVPVRVLLTEDIGR